MPSLTDLDVGIIGVGEIAGAIVDGLCTDPRGAPEVWLSPRGEATSEALARRYPYHPALSVGNAPVDRDCVAR